MAKAAFRVEDGIIPGHTDNDLGHSALQFRHTYISGNVQVGTDVNVTRDAVSYTHLTLPTICSV